MQRKFTSALALGALALAAALALPQPSAAAEPVQAAGQRQYSIPLFIAASHPTRQGFARITNLSDRSGEVNIVAIDDSGARFGPLSFILGPQASLHFNSDDLENGNARKGLSGSAGDGQGDWRLEIGTDLEIEPLAYIRTEDGFLTSMHGKGSAGALPILNPGSNASQRSALRLVNRGQRPAEAVITGVDDRGQSPGGEVRVSLAAGAARTIGARELEIGGSGLSGALGDGQGKWRLSIAADGPVQAMSLLNSPTGHLTNLSAALSRRQRIPLFMSASDPARQGFARIRNRSDRAGEVRVFAIDDAGRRQGPATLSLGANETVHFNSGDLEGGNADKGLSAGVGPGEGDWRLELSTDLNIEAAAYVRTADGFLTPMQDVARYVDQRHFLPIFNPGSNDRQRSRLRLANPGDGAVQVAITGVDDQGASPGGGVSLSLPAGAARTLDARELEAGGPGFSGALGDGEGKWRLFVTADGPLQAMSLLESPTGHLTNLSSAARGEPVALGISVLGGGEVAVADRPNALQCGEAGACQWTFEADSQIVLQAVPDTGREVRWAGCDRAEDDQCELSLGGARFVSATFLTADPPAFADNVIELSSAQIAGLMEHDLQGDGLLAFAPDTPGVDGWAEGDILVSGGSDAESDDSPPFAQRIERAEEQADRHAFSTAPASLDEIFASGSWSASASAEDADPSAVAALNRPAAMGSAGTGAGSGLSYAGLSGNPRFPHRLNVNLNFGGGVEVGGTIDFRIVPTIDHVDGGSPSTRYMVYADTDSRLRATVQPGASLQSARTVGAPIRFPPMPIYGPVFVVPELRLEVTVGVGVGAKPMGPMLSSDLSAVVGVRHSNAGGFAPVYHAEVKRSDFDLGRIDLDAQAQVEAGLQGVVTFKVMGLGGPSARFAGVMGVEKCAWGDYANAYGGARLGLGGELRVLGQAVQLDFPLWERVSQLGRHGLALNRRDSLFGLVSNLRIEDPAGGADDACPSTFDSLRLRWDALEGAGQAGQSCGIGYNIYRDGRRVAGGLAGDAFEDRGLADGQQYCYQVSANLPSGVETDRSAEVCGIPQRLLPGPPTDVEAEALSSSEARVSWDAPADDACLTGYRVLHGDRYVGSVRVGTRTARVRSLQPETRYCFHVRSASNAGQSESSPSACITTPAEQPLEAGERFRDCPECPEMVVVPAGTFQMGNHAVLGEPGPSSGFGSPKPVHPSDFGSPEPVHRVTIGSPFAMGVYEVTFAEWDACVAAGGCGGYRPRGIARWRGDEDGQRGGRHPVLNVSWRDAQRYVEWLSGRTGQRYRLPSEAEWEYAARAGTTGPYHTGSTISGDQANTDRGSNTTLPVGSFPANGFGLHDVLGNVWEWVQDCWNLDYQGAPGDGSAWENGNCSHRIMRGGCYGTFQMPVYARFESNIDRRDICEGFRVARAL